MCVSARIVMSIPFIALIANHSVMTCIIIPTNQYQSASRSFKDAYRTGSPQIPPL